MASKLPCCNITGFEVFSAATQFFIYEVAESFARGCFETWFANCG